LLSQEHLFFEPNQVEAASEVTADGVSIEIPFDGDLLSRETSQRSEYYDANPSGRAV
jgi:hypothetical protein